MDPLGNIQGIIKHQMNPDRFNLLVLGLFKEIMLARVCCNIEESFILKKLALVISVNI